MPKTPRDRYGEKQIDHEKILQRYGAIYHAPQRRKYRYLIGDLLNFIKFSKNLKKGDIIISFTEYAGKLTRLCRLFNKNIKYYHSHQCIDVFRKKGSAYYIELLIEKLLSKSIDFYIACSPSEVSILQNTFKVPSNKILFIPNYRDIKNNETTLYKNKKYDFIYLGRIVREKGIAELAEIFSSLGICDRLTCIGDGQDLANLKLIYPKIIFLGHVEHDHALNLLRESKFVISNSQIEGLPYSILEAISLGAIPVLSSVHGHRDLVVSGITGFLYNNTEELRNLLFKLINFDIKTYNKISNNVIKLSNNLKIFGKHALKNHFKKYE